MTSKKEIKKEIKYEKNRLKELDRKRIEKQKATGDYIYTPAIIKLARKIIRGSEAKKNVMGKVNISNQIVVAKEGTNIKTIRFGEKGASTAGKPKTGESARMKAKRKSFKARHGKNISKGKMSAAYWADKVKW